MPVTGVALKIMQLYRCVEVEGRFWLAADMRLECYTPQWVGFAIYGAVCGLVYIVGFPLVILMILCRNRRVLFDEKFPATRAKYGFLYEVCRSCLGRAQLSLICVGRC